jgi:hypothetical protein
MAASIVIGNVYFLLPNTTDTMYVWYKLASLLYTYKMVQAISYAAHCARTPTDRTLLASFCQ